MTLVRDPDAQASPGCYTLDLYCQWLNDQHGWNEFPHQYTGRTESECNRQARKRGWKIEKKSNYATCPKCAKII